MNRSESSSVVSKEMSRGKRAPAAVQPVRTLQTTARERVIRSPLWSPRVARAGRSVPSVSTRRSRRVHPLARPSRGRSSEVPFVAAPLQAGDGASVDLRLPMGIDPGARASGPRSPKTRGEARDSDDVTSPRGGVPFVATRCISAGAVRPITGPLVRAAIHDRRGPRPHRPHDCSRGQPGLRAPFLAARDPKVFATAHRALTWMHPETRRSRTSAAYLLSIFKDVHPVGATFATRSSWGGRVKPRVTPRRPRFGSNAPSLGP